MDSRVAPLALQFRLNTDFVRRALVGLQPEQAGVRAADGVSPIGFLVAHLIDARAYLTGILGGDPIHPWKDVFDAAAGWDDMKPKPSPDELLETFELVSARLYERLDGVSGGRLEQASGASFPGGDATVLGAISFLAFHDSYHVGQLAVLHRALGRGSLSGV